MIENKSQELGNACVAFDAAEIDELRAIAALHDEAAGLMMQVVNWAGSQVDSLLAKAPQALLAKIDEASSLALREAYEVAVSTQGETDPAGFISQALAWAQGERWHKVASAVTGALGGAGGFAGTIVDLPVTTTLILRSIQQVAAAHGEDISQHEVRAQCVAVFGLGGTLPEDDDTDLGLFTTRLALNGQTITAMISAVAPRFAAIVGQKLLTQATPLIGAVAGATINTIFTGYYQTMAHVHFRLRKLERAHDPDQVRACFERIVRARRAAEAEVLKSTAARRVRGN